MRSCAKIVAAKHAMTITDPSPPLSAFSQPHAGKYAEHNFDNAKLREWLGKMLVRAVGIGTSIMAIFRVKQRRSHKCTQQHTAGPRPVTSQPRSWKVGVSSALRAKGLLPPAACGPAYLPRWGYLPLIHASASISNCWAVFTKLAVSTSLTPPAKSYSL